jgi:hypothetical protein
VGGSDTPQDDDLRLVEMSATPGVELGAGAADLRAHVDA